MPVTLTFPTIYPLTDDSAPDISLVEQFVQFVDAGAEIVQLRAKRSTSAEIFAAASEMLKLTRRQNVKLIINDRVDIALAVGADGVHLGQTDLSPIEARRLLGDAAIIGYSTHNVDQLSSAIKMPIDYIAIGPIFPTETKSDTDPIVGLDMVRQARSIVGDMPLIAIGGISTDNAASVIAAGADSIAVISTLLSEAKIGERYAMLESSIKSAVLT